MDFGELSRAEGIGRTEQNNVTFVFPPPSVLHPPSSAVRVVPATILSRGFEIPQQNP